MGILAWIVVVLIAGWLASRVIRDGDHGLIVGVVGTLIGVFLATMILKMPIPISGINATSILVAVGGG